ncbi:hydroxysqualene dehydroxylase [Polyangium mundeleinium]|uniref:FAD-dependent oxidoreductase n=1 Tax=Polyangium mundeleinium TaxID=2995306 RepID=A0ABT5EU03_9BACT|nr:FAD-dependent oxidoreductase [Polyangium mundeleinium]MDC0744817.1 FAD-dependent oxidoreductase [Polyangium mundeleinium]
MARRTKVAILGGGIGGLSAAHELAELGDDAFEIDVYEASEAVGGKAKSQFLADTGREGRLDLPGEHGFRFFPAWYSHLPDVMQRIPRPGGGTVADNLVGCTEMGMAEVGARQVYKLKRHRPSAVGEFVDMLAAVGDLFEGTGISTMEMGRFVLSMLGFACASDERRRDVYENRSFFEFIRGATYSERFRRYINSSRFMVAMDAQRGSACTIGNKVLQLILDFFRPKGANDRVLNGPTATRWLDPWEAYLRSRGVRFHFGRPVSALEVDVSRRRIAGARIGSTGERIEADHFIASLPLEPMALLVGDDLAGLDASLMEFKRARVHELTAWMVGAQYFLRRDVTICDGHIAFPDAPWALSAISQAQFWTRGQEEAFSALYGDGSVAGVLSVDVSDWSTTAPGLSKTAAQCASKEEVLDEVWRQIKQGLNGTKEELLRDEDLVRAHLDTGIQFTAEGVRNASPLLVHPPGSWYQRPLAAPEGVQNLFFAADFVQTGTDLATMEGANEAARLAVNGLLAREGRSARATLFPTTEDAGPLMRKIKAWDRKSWLEQRRALPNLPKPPGPFRDGEGPSLDEVKRYQAELEAAARALPDLP